MKKWQPTLLMGFVKGMKGQNSPLPYELGV